MKSSSMACVAAALSACAFAGPAAAATPQQIRTALAGGVTYLKTQQNANGTFGIPNSGNEFGGNTAYSALSAAGAHPADVAQTSGTNAQDGLVNTLTTSAFLTPSAPSDSASRPSVFERSILEAEAAGIDSRRVAPTQNLVAQLAGYYNGGYFNVAPNQANPERRSLNYAVFGALALEQAGAPQLLLDQSVRVIRQNQHNDGGWDFPLAITDQARAGDSDVDTTGATLAALCQAGVPRTDSAVQGGVNFLRGRLTASGAVVSAGQYSSANVSSNAWAVSGLNKCGIDPQGTQFTSNSGNTLVDYILSQRNNDGGFFSAYNADPQNPNAPIASDVYSTQDALRPLGGEAFSATAPARASASDPRRRPVPAVADGTSVPLALAVDDGSGAVTFCRVTVPSGSSLATLLATANGSSAPGGCATGAEFTGGSLSKLNGRTGTWALSIDRGAEQVAAGQTVRFGDLVALRRTSSATPATPAAQGGTSPQPVPAATQAKTEAASVASKSLRATKKKRTVTVSVMCAKENRLCQGVAYVVYRKRTLGRRPFLVAGGKTTKLNVKLSKSGTKRIGRSKKVRVNVFSRDANGIASTFSKVLTLKIGG